MINTLSRRRINTRTSAGDWTLHEGGPLAICALFVVLIICGVPILQLVLAATGSFSAGVETTLKTFFSAQILTATSNTISVALASTIIAGTIGISLTLILMTVQLRARRLLAFVFILSLMISPQISALAFKTLAGPASPLLKAFGLAPPPGTPNPMLGFGGIVLVMGLQHAPLVAITLAAGLSRVPHSIIEAALLDGAKPLAIFSRILLPLVRPHVASALLLAFVAGVGNFGIPALLGLPVGYMTLPTLIFQKLASFGTNTIAEAALISMLIGIIASIGVIASARLLSRNNVRLQGGDRLAVFINAGRWRVWIEYGLWSFFILTIFIPMMSLLATSIVPAYGMLLRFDTLTLDQYVEVLWRQDITRRAFSNSMIYASFAAIILSIFCMLLAYVLDRRLTRIRSTILALVEMPYALPGVVVGIACILLFARPLPIIGVSIYATKWVILFAYCASFMAIALKPIFAAITSLDRDIEEAALLDGAGLRQRLLSIIMPLILPSLLAGALMVFLIAFNELTVSALLWSAGTETIGVVLLNLEDAGLPTQAAAMAVVSTMVVAILMLVLEVVGDMFPENTLPWRQLSAAQRNK
ncbi:iron ABC transporter permease [Ahrensia kielensis]|uniref:Iron ABC transporter permease n=1 Tax=Ahrensia kielensis TaxID=76980 RepID=A0ABU9T7P0_9HYPH